MIRAHKIKIYPSKNQSKILDEWVNIYRFAFNKGLDLWNKVYELGEEKPSANLIKKLYRKLVNETEQYHFAKSISSSAIDYVFMDLQAAFRNFFQKRARHPNFKKRFYKNGSFSLSNISCKFKSPRLVQIPKLGNIKLSEELRYEGKIQKYTFREYAGEWFLAIFVDIGQPEQIAHELDEPVGIDMGLKDFVVLSDGSKLNYNKKQIEKLTKKMKKEQRKLSRKVKGSQNRKKQIIKVQKAHRNLENAKMAFIHNATCGLSKKFSKAFVEDLNVKGMMKNKKLAHRFQEMSLSKFIEILSYKMTLEKRDRWFASSKICSVCGEKNNNLTLDIREWVCNSCNTLHDRDVNAARNLIPESYRGIHA